MYSFILATPEKVLFNDFIHSVIVPGSVGYFEVLQNHAPIISTLKLGKVTLIDKNHKKWVWEITGGFVEVLKNEVTLLADSLTPNFS